MKITDFPKYGYVYILSNASMPGLVKIGRTSRSTARRKNELYQTGVPTPFTIEMEVLSPDCAALEADIHKELSQYRVNDQREFFELNLRDAKQMVSDRLQDQLQELVDLFSQWFSLTDESCFIDPATVHIAADRCGLDTRDMNVVFEHLSKEELDSAADRFAAINPSFRDRLRLAKSSSAGEA